MTKKRIKEIDICRGLGIILVVLGHALKQTGELTGILNILLKVIYSFHMPLFFALSGFTAVKILRFTMNEERVNYAKNRARRLLIPYFVIGVLYMPLKFFMSRYAVKPYDFGEAWKILIGDNPNTALWFCYVLFVCCVLGAFILRRNNLKLMYAASFVVSVALYTAEIDFRIGKYFFFFMTGMLIRENYDKVRDRLNSTGCMLLALALFVAGNIAGLEGVTVLYVITALAGSELLYWLSCRLTIERGEVEKSPLWENAVTLAGEFSMDIYIFSEPIMTVIRLIMWNILGLGQLATIGGCFIGSIIIAIPVSKYIVRRVRLFRVLFLGMD